MTNEEKAIQLSTDSKGNIQAFAHMSALEMALWKDEKFASEKQALIDNACNEFSKFLEEMKEIWWKGDGCDESVKSHWLISFRKSMDETK